MPRHMLDPDEEYKQKSGSSPKSFVYICISIPLCFLLFDIIANRVGSSSEQYDPNFSNLIFLKTKFW